MKKIALMKWDELDDRKPTYALVAGVDLVIVRFDDEVYGECLRCGEEIGLPRLEVKPEATLCIDCQSRQEAGAR